MASRFRRRVLFAVALLTILVAVLAAIVLAVFSFGSLPLKDGTILGGGCVEAVAEGWGPVTIGSYLIALHEGGFALVDAGMDPDAGAIRSALKDRGADPGDVRYIFITHAHGDHIGGIGSFPDAEIHAVEADARAIQESSLLYARGLADGDVVSAAGTDVEVFALPGHTPGSAAYLACGVLFLGDSAAAAYDGSITANRLFSEDSRSTRESLAALAHRLKGRANDVLQIAFGHQGPVDGLGPLLEWASTAGPQQGS